MEHPSSYIPDDIWREILRNVCDFRSCLALHLTSKKLRKIIQYHYEIAQANKDLWCIMMGPPLSGKATLLAQLGLNLKLFQQCAEHASIVDSLKIYNGNQKNYLKCTFELDSIGRKATIAKFSRFSHSLLFRRYSFDLSIFVMQYTQALQYDTLVLFRATLAWMRVSNLSQILVVVTHMNESLEQQEYYRDARRSFIEEYERYKEYWPELTMQLVPVDAITGWNLFPCDSERHERLSLWEALQKFHAKVPSINCPWRIFCNGDPNEEVVKALLVSGELKIGDKIYHNSEIAREITEISIDSNPSPFTMNPKGDPTVTAESPNEVAVKKIFAQRNPLMLKFHGATAETNRVPKNYVYGPGIKRTSSFMARMVFLETILLPLKSIALRCLGMPVMTKFEVIEYLDPITHEPFEKDHCQSLYAGETIIAKIEAETPFYIELESTYPDLAKVYLTSGQNPNTGVVVAAGMVIKADWTNEST